jgi:tetratricopeptide (TPR) repeat protein
MNNDIIQLHEPQVTLPKLDGNAGPAQMIDAQKTKTLVAATLQAHRMRQQNAKRRMLWQWAAGIALFIGSTAIVSASLLRRGSAKLAENLATAPVVRIADPLPPAIVEQPPVTETAPQERPPAPHQHSFTPADLLARANELRSHAHWAKAAQTYEHAVRISPRSNEAYAASVAAAVLYREKLHDPRRAVRLFQRALTTNPTGPLAQEARWGLAASFAQLGQKQAESEALRSFLQHHPDSVLAPQAKARLTNP